jgi:hypothetical protein
MVMGQAARIGSSVLGALASAHQRTAAPGELNYPFFDVYSLAHAAVGALLRLSGLAVGWLLLIAVGWEIAEHLLKNLVPAVFPHATQDTLANSIGDVLSALAGWFVAARAAAAAHTRRASG